MCIYKLIKNAYYLSVECRKFSELKVCSHLKCLFVGDIVYSENG